MGTQRDPLDQIAKDEMMFEMGYLQAFTDRTRTMPKELVVAMAKDGLGIDDVMRRLLDVGIRAAARATAPDHLNTEATCIQCMEKFTYLPAPPPMWCSDKCKAKDHVIVVKV